MFQHLYLPGKNWTHDHRIRFLNTKNNSNELQVFSKYSIRFCQRKKGSLHITTYLGADSLQWQAVQAGQLRGKHIFSGQKICENGTNNLYVNCCHKTNHWIDNS